MFEKQNFFEKSVDLNDELPKEEPIPLDIHEIKRIGKLQCY